MARELPLRKLPQVWSRTLLTFLGGGRSELNRNKDIEGEVT